jgi:uncharacterized protein (TIGR00251 family)
LTPGAGDLNVARTPEGVRFTIHVTPRARVRRVGGLHGDALRVAVTAPPVEGAANRAVVEALAEALGLRRGDLQVASGARGRRKAVVARGDPERLERRLLALASD